MSVGKEVAVRQLDDLIAAYENTLGKYHLAKGPSPNTDLADEYYAPQFEALVVRVETMSARLTHQGDPFRRAFQILVNDDGVMAKGAERIQHLLKALRAEYAGGYMQSLAELIHGEVFEDLLDMANHLEEEGYEVAGTVIAGTVLEEHVRKLCQKYGIALEGGSGKPKTVDLMNADLVKATAYRKSVQAQVTAWYALRNEAAHGKMQANTFSLVGPMIAGIRVFVSQHPA